MKATTNTILYALFALCGVFFMQIGVCHAAPLFTENFNSGAPAGWNMGGGTIESSDTYEGAGALQTGGQYTLTNDATLLGAGSQTLYVKVPTGHDGRLFYMDGDGGYTAQIILDTYTYTGHLAAWHGCENACSYYDLGAIPHDTWFPITITWTGMGHNSVQFTINGGATQGWFDPAVISFNNSSTGYKHFRFFADAGAIYWDALGGGLFVPTATLSVSSPASASTITSDATHIVGSYSGLSAGDYGFGYLRLWFSNPNNQAHSLTYTTPLLAGNGTFSVPLSEFGITENGRWDFHAQQEMDANLFYDLSPSPTYYLNFNIAGNSTPYTFTDWNTWYSNNAAGGYSAPSDFGNSIEGFFQPIFTNVYEFANNTLAYFNADTAYDKGHQVGQIFPTAQAYLDNINLFFGGFPLVPFFEFLIVVMLGIFIVRTIFKFIPFFG